MPKEYLNPPELFPSLQYGFSQIVTSSGGTLVFLSGQVAWDEQQQIVGPGDLRTQTWQAFRNIQAAMVAAGGTLTDVVSLRIYVVAEKLAEESHHISDTLRAFFPRQQAPATTWLGVRALADEAFLIEIEAVAVIEYDNVMTRRIPGAAEKALTLRDVIEDDLPTFFAQQLDPAANHMAAFTVKDPADREAFMGRWTRILDDETIAKKTILYHGRVAGHVLSFLHFGKPEVSYWLGKAYWGKGLATAALRRFLEHLPGGPLYARAAKDNAASLRVLAKCGFAIVGEGRAFANARGAEVEEYILKLEASASEG